MAPVSRKNSFVSKFNLNCLQNIVFSLEFDGMKNLWIGGNFSKTSLDSGSSRSQGLVVWDTANSKMINVGSPGNHGLIHLLSCR
jgi:hypothetical protein